MRTAVLLERKGGGASAIMCPECYAALAAIFTKKALRIEDNATVTDGAKIDPSVWQE